MYWEKCNINFFSSGSREFVKISGYDVVNNKPHWIYISRESFRLLQSGVPVNMALKDYSIDIKEFVISGFSPTNDSVFSFEREPLQTAFVTNAVANSVVFYAMIYLNNRGLTPNEIKELRTKYSLSNLDSGDFSKKELKDSFVNQSAFFLNLYKEMNENDRFEHFAENLEQQKRFKDIFINYDNFISLKKNYGRRIFHNKLECEFMRSDYHEKTFHPNTGVFSENVLVNKRDYYSVDRAYLSEMKMRICKVCGRT